MSICMSMYIYIYPFYTLLIINMYVTPAGTFSFSGGTSCTGSGSGRSSALTTSLRPAALGPRGPGAATGPFSPGKMWKSLGKNEEMLGKMMKNVTL